MCSKKSLKISVTYVVYALSHLLTSTLSFLSANQFTFEFKFV
jgi:hypothetical protein